MPAGSSSRLEAGHEHPGDVFPELIEGAPKFEANGLGHPLIAEDVCVRNNVRLDSSVKFYLVSGSNTAGKSTFLRAIGINAILAAAGGPFALLTPGFPVSRCVRLVP